MEPSHEKAVFKALLFSGDTGSRAWSQLFSLLLQLKFVSDGVSVKLLAIHEQRQEVVYELCLHGDISVSMKSDFVQWHTGQSDATQAYGARFMRPTDADTFHGCFQQLIEAVCQSQTRARRNSDMSRPAVLPHPSVRLPASLQLTVLLPDGRRVTEFASHATRLKDLLRKVCGREGLPYKHHYLKPEKLRLDPQAVPLDMKLTLGEVKISKLQLMDRRAEREISGRQLSFSNPWGGVRDRSEDRDKGGQIQLLQGTFNRIDSDTFHPIGGVEFRSPTRVSVTGLEQVVSPVDSLDESELSAPFRAFLQEDRPKRSSSLRSRTEAEQSFLDRPHFTAAPLHPSPRQSPHRETFSEPDIREAVTLLSDPSPRPSTPNRRRAPKPPPEKPAPVPVPAVQEPVEPVPEPGTLRSKKSQVSLFKVSEDLNTRLQDEFSQRLSERQSRSPPRIRADGDEAGESPSGGLGGGESRDSGLGTETGNSSGESHTSPSGQDRTVLDEVVPLAASTPDKRTPPIKPKPQIAPKPSRLLQAIHRRDTPPRSSFPLYPSTPAQSELLLSQNQTVRGVAGHVGKWRSHLDHQSREVEESPSGQLVFRPHTSDVSEPSALVFNLPPPPPDSPPLTPPPVRFSDLDQSETPDPDPIPLIPPPMDDLSQSDSDSSGLLSINHLHANDIHARENDVITIDRNYYYGVTHGNDVIASDYDGGNSKYDEDDVIAHMYGDDVTELQFNNDDVTKLQFNNDDVMMEKYYHDDVITAGDESGGDSDVTEDLIVLPPPHFYGAEDSDTPEFTFPAAEFSTPHFAPPTPLRMSLNLEALPDSPTDPPPPPLLPPPPSDALDTDAGGRNAEGDRTSRLAELLTAAANSLNGESAQASELVRAALQLINQQQPQPAERGRETLVRASYHHTDEASDSTSRTPPDFSRYGSGFQACMQDIRTDKATALKPTPETSPPASPSPSPETELDSSQEGEGEGEGEGGVASALARAMKDRRFLLEQTSNSRLDDMSLQQTLSDDWM